MPSVILLDRSLSMRRPAGKDNPDHTRHSLACRGLEWFLDYMGQSFPLEYTAILTFSSACDVLVPFTRDYAQLKEKLEEVTVLDRTDIHNALVVMVEIMVSEWGSFAPCQAVLVTDGSLGVKHQDVSHRKQQTLCIPFPCQLHVVCVATREELSQPSWANKLEKLCDLTGITQSDVFIPSGHLGVESVQATFRQLAKDHYRPYTGILKCGHLQSQICLSPTPHMCKSNFDLAVTPDHKFPKLEETFSIQYPKELSICGFLDVSCLPAPPIYARHFLLDPVTDERSLEAMRLTRGSSKPEVSLEDSQKPSFRVLLHGSLKCESKVALVKLGEKWYGALFSQTSSTKKSNLVLTVYYPDSDVPWLGQFSYLGPKSFTNVTDPRRGAVGPVQPSDSEKNLFPVVPPRHPSFQNPSSLLWASEAVLQADVTKVIRYSRKLPEKESSLVKELNKLRLIALTYTMPELTDMLCAILSKEETTAANPQIRTLLQQCRHFLANNRNVQERLVVTHK